MRRWLGLLAALVMLFTMLPLEALGDSTVLSPSVLPPSVVTVSKEGSEPVKVHWNRSYQDSLNSSYQLFRKGPNDSDFQMIYDVSYYDAGSYPVYKDEAATKVGIYQYYVITSRSIGEETVISEPSQTVTCYVLGKVKHLKITQKKATFVLKWDKTPNASGYQIWYSKNGDDFTRGETVTKNTYQTPESYGSSAHVMAGSQYWYYVVPIRNTDDGLFTGEPCDPVTGMILNTVFFQEAKNVPDKSVVLEWNSLTSYHIGYEIYYSTSKKAPTDKAKGIIKVRRGSVRIRNLKKKTYYFFIRPVARLKNGKAIKGPWSAAKKIKVKK